MEQQGVQHLCRSDKPRWAFHIRPDYWLHTAFPQQDRREPIRGAEHWLREHPHGRRRAYQHPRPPCRNILPSGRCRTERTPRRHPRPNTCRLRLLRASRGKSPGVRHCILRPQQTISPRAQHHLQDSATLAHPTHLNSCFFPNGCVSETARNFFCSLFQEEKVGTISVMTPLWLLCKYHRNTIKSP